MPSPSLPPKLRKRLDKIEAELKSQDFYILIWGSGATGGELYAKRLKVREFLGNTFGAENVIFSEDAAFQEYVERYGHVVSEAIQALGVDAIIILDTSIGPHTELLKYEEILRGKSIVFVPHKYKESSGFATSAYEVLKVEGYTEEQFDTCETIRERANRFAQALRLKKFERQRFREIFG